MAKKVRDRELEEEVIAQEDEDSGSILDFLTHNRNAVMGAVAVIALIIVGSIFYNSMQNRKNAEAEGEMFRAIRYFESDSLDRALTGGGQFLGFQDIAEDYSGTDAANLANYYIGIIYLKKGDVDGGIAYLKKFSKGSNMLSMSAYMALGFAHEDKGDPSAAAGYFEQAASTPGENEFSTPTMLMHAARNYEEAGASGKALNIYQKIKEKYPTSTEGLTIDKYIGRVSAQ